MGKTRLRQQLHQILLDMSPNDRLVKSKQVCKNLIATEQFANSHTIMSFLSIQHEVDTTDIILYAWQMGKIVAVPKVSWQQRHMLPIEITTLETGLSEDAAGIRTPMNGAPTPFEEIDLVITPGLAFDRKGNRLGRGGSYYDRFFAQKELNAVKCAVAFEEQLVESVPVGELDVQVDMLVTQKQVYYFNSDSK